MSTPGPSGYEANAAAVWREAASFAEIETDKLGSSIARVAGTAEDTLVAVVGHIDEIGLAITHVDEKGFAWFTTVGGWDPQILVGQRVTVDTKDGPVPGVIGRKPIHLLKDEQRKKVVEIEGLHIDVGAADRDEALALLRIGDSVVIDARAAAAGRRPPRLALDGQPPRLLRRARVRAPLPRARRPRRRASPGSRRSRRRSGSTAPRPLPTCCSRRSRSSSTSPTRPTRPGVDEKENGSHPLGSGPVIGRGATLAPKVFELLVETAERERIEYSIETSGRRTATDADAYQISRAGIPTGLVSIPLRYMHSPVELVDLGDVEATIELFVAFATSLDPDVDLSR